MQLATSTASGSKVLPEERVVDVAYITRRLDASRAIVVAGDEADNEGIVGSTMIGRRLKRPIDQRYALDARYMRLRGGELGPTDVVHNSDNPKGRVCREKSR